VYDNPLTSIIDPIPVDQNRIDPMVAMRVE